MEYRSCPICGAEIIYMPDSPDYHDECCDSCDWCGTLDESEEAPERA